MLPTVKSTSSSSTHETAFHRALLTIIREAQPESITGLAVITGRKPGNLSRTLKTMSGYGLVEMKRENRHVRPVVNATEFQILAAA
jgi:predicted transcriptional regulator